MPYRCCDCGETKATKGDLEAHLNADHIGWTPYQCFYCCQQGVSTRKPNKELLRDHVAQRHPDQQFTFLCTDDHIKEDRLKDMINRSMENDASLSRDVTSTTTPMAVTAPSPVSISPFIISLSASPDPQPKAEVLILDDSEAHSTAGCVETLTQAPEQQVDDIDVKGNFSAVRNSRCATCQESVPRSLVLIRDHVKLHFKEKTGCVPADLTKLLPNLQQIYCQLLMTSFPSIGASIMDDDIPNCTEETIDQRMSDGQPHSRENRTDSISQQLAQLSSPDHHSPTHKASVLISCDVCNEKFASTYNMHCHRARKHGIRVRYHCKECKCDLSSGGSNGYQEHLLHKHLHKPKYECSQCGNSNVTLKSINRHDRLFHDGLGKAHVINNGHQLKAQLETLQKDLIIDLNHQSTSWNLNKSKKSALRNILSLKRDHLLKSRTVNHSKNAVKIIAKAKPKTTLFTCEICNKNTPTLSGLKSHRNKKHGMLVKWHCKQCNENLLTDVKTHLRTVHLNDKKPYECSLCDKTVEEGNINHHDKQFHGGLGKAQIVNNQLCYKEQLEELEKKFIIDVNSSSSEETGTTTQIPTELNIGIPYVTCQKLSHDFDDRLLADGSKCSTNTEKLVSKKQPITGLSCEICKKTFSSFGQAKYHRFHMHGISVNWYCKECKINLQSSKVNIHILLVHLGNYKFYECNLCQRRTTPGKINHHDILFHGGLGNALAVNNLVRYKVKLEELRRKLIIDQNSSSSVIHRGKKLKNNNSKKPVVYHTPLQKKDKSIVWNMSALKHIDNEISPESLKTAEKVVDGKTKRTKSILSCQICDLTFSSTRELTRHRHMKHGISVQWHCKQCKINLGPRLIPHLLRVHMGKQRYVCSLCNSGVTSDISAHDRIYHNGFGKAEVIYNPHHYRKELEDLRDALIIDTNADKQSVHKSKSFTGQKSESVNSIQSPSVSPGESIVKIQSKSGPILSMTTLIG